MAVNRKFCLDGMSFDLIICKQGDIFFHENIDKLLVLVKYVSSAKITESNFHFQPLVQEGSPSPSSTR